MHRILLRLCILILGIILASYIVPGITVSGPWPAIKAAILLGLFNIFIKPVLFILTLPINLITLGLFTLIINGFLLWSVGHMVTGFEVSGFFVSVLGSVIISILSIAINRLIPD